MGRDTFGRSLWSALTEAHVAAAPLEGQVTADVAVVGAGLLGLCLALHLQEKGASVVLLEAAEPGFGASGRNTGFVVPSLRTSLSPDALARRLGPFAERLLELVGRSGTIVFDLVRRLGLDCAAEQTGWMQPAHTRAALDTLRQRQADWAKRGRSVEILDAAETARRLGAPGFHGALFDPTGGQINPLAYARGLAAAARSRGVALHEGSPATRIARTGTRCVVETPRGRVTADRVVLATNALVGGLAPAVADSIVPARVHQVATAPLSRDLQDAILPARSPAADTRRHTLAVRWSPDGRLMTGGLVLPGPGRLGRAARYFIRRLETFFPQTAPLRADYVWDGVIATTPDGLPRLMTVSPGVDALIGCNGRGIAMTAALAQALAAYYVGDLPASALPLPLEAPRPIPGQPIVRAGPALWLPWSNFRDRRDTARP